MKYFLIGIAIGLLTFYSATCQSLNNEQVNFLKRYAKNICLDSLQECHEWSYILPHIKGKKLILIGELNHGASEIFEVRNSLIQYLHKETGVKTILFESGIGELIEADMDQATMSASQMKYGLFGGWRTKEFIDLFEYIKEHDISIAGYDVQRTGGSFATILKRVAREYSIDTLSTYDLESRYSLVARELTNRKAVYDSLKTSTTALILDYQKVSNELSDFLTIDAPKELMLADITIQNRINYLLYMLQFLQDKDWNRRWAARDSAMAKNVIWLMEHLYKDEPVIIIGHNFHIGLYNENELVMGEILKTIFKNDMYAIGIFAGAGSYNDNAGVEVEMVLPDSAGLDIKHVIAHLPGVTFIDIPKKFDKGSAWLNQEITINDTFIDLQNSNKMVLARAFDGVILLKKVSPAKWE